jgi:hypothetical protein
VKVLLHSKGKTRFEYFGNVCVITPHGLVGGR